MSNPNNLPMTNPNPNPQTEEHKVSGDQLLQKVKQIVKEGNARRITIKNESGHVLMEFPLTIGVASVVLIPVWVAIGAIAALAGHYTIAVEKRTP
ncbi:MAG TPA: DUF4342 domain-containing protein [Gemmatimonadaceae bacterium]|nr:DUF4342 domain-containing protein [Gemmatimonadaceae bacterium]